MISRDRSPPKSARARVIGRNEIKQKSDMATLGNQRMGRDRLIRLKCNLKLAEYVAGRYARSAKSRDGNSSISFFFFLLLVSEIYILCYEEKDINFLLSGIIRKDKLRRKVRNRVGTPIEIQRPNNKFLTLSSLFYFLKG